ncbi:MAG: InlB B-repeat-containing protein [Clostridia bacterium]|nr:InlB B-repeat-containing protein [Clostridia bacterium]
MKIITRIVVVILALVMLLPVAFSTVAVAQEPETKANDKYQNMFGIYERSPMEQLDMDGLSLRLGYLDLEGRYNESLSKINALKQEAEILEREIEQLKKEQAETEEENKKEEENEKEEAPGGEGEANKKEEAKKKDNKALERSAKAADALIKGLPSLLAACKNEADGKSMDIFKNVISLASSVAACFGPYGALISAGINAIGLLVELCVGGKAPTSEMAQMEDRLNQQLDDIKNQISGVEEQINDLSNQINESTNRILEEIPIAIENAEARAYVQTFLLSGEGNFSYNQYRNYFYGATTGNSKGTTAYYSLLKQAIISGASDDVVKGYYDRLYTSIMNDRDEYYDYIIGSEVGKSIVQYYYDVLKAYPEITEKNGSTPEHMALLFAYDLYETERMSSEIVAACNLYQYSYMLLNETEYYVYDQSTGAMVTRTQIEGTVDLDSIYDQGVLREGEIQLQLAKDIAYILDISNSYILESSDGRIYEVANNDEQTFGNIAPNQIVYLNQIPKSIYESIGMESEDFTYYVNVPVTIDGIFVADANTETIVAQLCYKGVPVSNMEFTVGTSGKFQGGSGTADDPYLIATAEQFLSIGKGLDEHYCLIDNIDFEGMRIEPFGERENSVGTVVYDEFTGSLNGNGYTISNLEIKGDDYGTHLGLFGIIGESGEVSDLTLYNVKAWANLQNAADGTTSIYAGTVAGENKGKIRFCHINSDGSGEIWVREIANYRELIHKDLSDEERRFVESALASGKIDLYDGILWNFFEYPDLMKYTKSEFIPNYGVSLELNNNVLDRNIFAYTGGIAGSNSNTIACCVVENVAVEAYIKHDFAGNPVAKNKLASYAGGICGINQHAVGYTITKESTKILNRAESISDSNSKTAPFVTALAGGAFGKTTKIDYVINIDARAVIFYSNAHIESNLIPKHHNRVEDDDEFCPTCTEDDIERIKATEDVEAVINSTRYDYDITLQFGESNEKAYEGNYLAGESLTEYFVLTKTETALDVTTKTYVCDALGYKLLLSDDGNGRLIHGEISHEFEYKRLPGGKLEYASVGVVEKGISSMRLTSGDKCVVAEINTLRTESLKAYVGGVEREYEIVSVYGFDTMNKEHESVMRDVTFLIAIDMDGKTIYASKKVTMTVGANVRTGIEVENLKDFYKSGEFSAAGLVLKYNYAVGAPIYVTVKEDLIGTEFIVEGGNSGYGKQKATITYAGVTVIFDVYLVCGHGSNFIDEQSGYEHIPELSKPSSCSEVGYNYYECKECGDVKLFYLRKLEHTPDYDSVEKPSCTSDSVVGRVNCAVCKEVMAEGVLIPKQTHNYIYYDENTHICVNGNHGEYHHYSVSEETRLVTNEDGSQSWYIVYTYTCVCKKDGSVFAKEVVDENEITDKERELPTVVVSNGYVLNGGDLVVVYVQLINNPGVKAVNFGIRYSDGLELVGKPQNGDLFKGSMVSESGAVDYGYNFLLANSALVEGDGNILKLTFKVTEAAKLGDEYKISVVYSDMGASKDGVQIEGGFSNGKRINVITRDGYIKVVEDLPGDVNDDGIVDLMDAVLLAKFYVNSSEYPLDTKEADLNLDKAITPDDIVALLEYIVGGYGTNLMTQDFEVVLNTNGLGYDLNDIKVSIYEENSTYGEAGLVELNRTGYKFLGWFDRISGGNRVALEDAVRYNPNQKKQVLYAQWELNAVKIDGNGSTDGKIEDMYYPGNSSIVIDENEYKKEYNVAFISDKPGKADVIDVLKYKLLYWQGSNGVRYMTIAQAIGDMKNKNYGEVTLTAVWADEPTIIFPEMVINGYEKQVSWYGDKGFSMVTEIKSNEDILRFEPVNGYYMVYAKHTPVVYDLMVDFNGGTGIIGGSSENDDNEPYIADCSVENAYDLSRVTITSEGRSLSGWDVYVDNAFCDQISVGTSIGYIPKAKQGSIITLKAVWDMKSYKITYTLNGGVVLDEQTTGTEGKISKEAESALLPVYFGSYRLDTIDTISLPEPVYKEYYRYHRFVGWYMDEEFAQPFDREVLKANPQDVTLYAKWDLSAVYDYTNTPEKIINKYVIIDWSDDPDGKANNGKNILIEDATEIYIVGNEAYTYDNVTFNLYSSKNNQPVKLELKSFKIKGAICQASISMTINLTLDCIGECLVQAPSGYSAIRGFGAIKLGSDAMEPGVGALTIKVGNYCGGGLQPVNAGSIEGKDSKYEITTYLEATAKDTGNSANGYVFNGWHLNGTMFEEKLQTHVEYGAENLTAFFTSKWYEPLSLDIQNFNNDDLKDIGTTESKYIYITGGSGNYTYDRQIFGSGASASYDTSNSIFTVKKNEDAKNGRVRFTVIDKNSEQSTYIEFDWSTNGCFTGDTMVALADGSYARLDSLKQGDLVFTWNAITGRLEPMPISLFWNHGEAWYNVITLGFSNGNTVKVVEEHGFFDITLNKFVYIDSNNYKDFLGHSFACLGEGGTFENAVLISAEMKYEYSSCYSLRSACNDNVIVEGFMTLTAEDLPNFLTYFEFGEDFMYDKEKMDADIEKYGLFTYEEWKDYVSYEEFIALNGQYFKILLGKGYLTVDDIFTLIEGMR